MPGSPKLRDSQCWGRGAQEISAGQLNAKPRFIGCASAGRLRSRRRPDTEGVATGAESLAAALGQSAELDIGGRPRSRGRTVSKRAARFPPLWEVKFAGCGGAPGSATQWPPPRAADRRSPPPPGLRIAPRQRSADPTPECLAGRSEPLEPSSLCPSQGEGLEPASKGVRCCGQWRRRRRQPRTSGGLYWGVRRTGAGAERSGGRVEGKAEPGRNGAGVGGQQESSRRGKGLQLQGARTWKPQAPLP